MKQARIVLLASGGGSIAQSIIDAVANGDLDAKIVGLISDQPEAQVLKRASSAKIDTFIIPMVQDRKSWDLEFLDQFEMLYLQSVWKKYDF